MNIISSAKPHDSSGKTEPGDGRAVRLIHSLFADTGMESGLTGIGELSHTRLRGDDSTNRNARKMNKT